jgi:hypothetical protein
MPADALPIPTTASSAGLPGAVTHRREYRDPLGRPMTGTATITGGTRTADGHTIVVPVAVPRPVVGGVLEVELPPGEYRIVAALRTVDGKRISDTHKVTL